MSSTKTRGEETESAHVRELLQQIPRTLLAYKLYAPTNKLRQEMFQELVRRFESTFEDLESLPIQVESNRLLFEGEPTLDLPEDESHFVFHLYKDGARQLVFNKGITEEEISRFLDIIRNRPGQRGDEYNIVDALWEADLPHVAHVAADGFTELLAAEAGEDAESAGAAAVAMQFQNVVGALTGDTEEDSAETEESGEESQQQALRVNERVATPLRNIMQEPLTTSRALARWTHQLEQEDEQILLTHVEDLLFYVLEDPSDPLSEDDFVRLYGQLLRERLLLGRFGAASELVTRLQRVRFELPQWADLPTRVLQEFGGSALAELVLTNKEARPPQSASSSALTFFEGHLALSDQALIELIKLDLNEFGEALLGAMLYGRMSAAPSTWLPRLATLPTRPLVIALNDEAIANRTGEDFLALLWEAFELDDDEVVCAAISSYPGRDDERFRDFLIEMLEDDSQARRCAAARRLGESSDSGIGAFLVNRLRRVGLDSFDEEEAATLIEAILSVGADRYVPVIRGQLEQLGAFKGHFLVPDALSTQRAERHVEIVLCALADCRAPAAIELLREVRQKAKGSLRERCDELWRNVVAEWSDENRKDSDAAIKATPIVGDAESRALPDELEDSPPEAIEGELPEEANGEEAPLDLMLQSFLDEVE